MSDEVKQLYRSKDDRWLAGVCGGLGKYFNIDPTIVRVLFILFAAAVGGGILIYLILWIVIPEEPGAVEAADVSPKEEAVAEESESD